MKMGEIELSENYLAEIAGWEVMKQARSMLAQNRVMHANWSAPILKGLVQTNKGSLRAGLVFRSRVDVENLCPCRPSKEWGTMCAHSIGIGLRILEERIPKNRQAQKESNVKSIDPIQNTNQFPYRLANAAHEASLKLWIIFPPNWKEAIARGKISLFFEAETDRGRCPLSVIAKSQKSESSSSKTFSLLPEDAPLFEAIQSFAKGVLPAMGVFDLAAFAKLIPHLQGHSRLTIAKKNPLTITDQVWIPEMSAMLDANGSLHLKSENPSSNLFLIPASTPFVVHEDQMQPLGLPADFAEILQGEMVLKRSKVPAFLQSCGDFLFDEKHCRTNFSLDDFQFIVLEPRFVLSLIGGLAQLQAQLFCHYDEQVFTLNIASKKEPMWMPDADSRFRFTMRNHALETRAIDHLLQAGFDHSSQKGCFELRGQDAVLDFFAKDFPNLNRQWELHLDERLQSSIEKNLERVQPNFQISSSGIDWIDMKIHYESDAGRRFSEAEIAQWLLSGRNHRRLDNGKIAMWDTKSMNEFREVLRDCAPIQRKGKYQMDARQAKFLDASIADLGWNLQGKSDWRNRLEALNESIPPLHLGHLEGVLRDYQKQGVNWIHLLRHSHFGGILADEMGLGKTLQVLAMIEGLRLLTKKSKGRSFRTLVICPTSLVFNWLGEAKRFTPELSAIGIGGSRRSTLFDQIEKHDLIVTSYALIRRDIKKYENLEFDLLVLDEAQHIKNRSTQNARAVKSIPSQHRLVLTGTPMENSILDLWSIFDFLMPGYLGTAADFRERYELPITKDKSRSIMERLRRRLRPFVLRRTKKEVAPELPKKIDQTILCHLTKEQRDVYAQMMDLSRRELFGTMSKTGQQRMLILKAITRLRQICCDLRLLNLPSEPKEPSGKLSMFHEILNEVLDGDHRVLVFSQFVSMLQLIRKSLDEIAIEYCYLDGATRDREAEVARFQKGKSPVFLISLKAGGVGLNLTAADTVLHFDPWWNPAIEDQASDRAHRIGQSRVVSSYKLIAQNTIEEKILQLQKRKREMIEGTLGSETQFAQSLTLDDFQELLSN